MTVLNHTLEFWSLPKREAFLQSLSGSVGNFELEFPKGTFANLSVYMVPVELPVYRLDNGRTLMDQEEYLVKSGKEADFFSKDPDSLEALLAQDQILRGMLNEAGLLRYFKTHKQLQPLVLTGQGRVVNGNRRLCAMRLLYGQSATDYPHFGHVRIIVLPHSDRKDIAELEARLQLHQDIKADYAWISEALTYKALQQNEHLKLPEVARFYEVSEKAARERLQMLADADRYLVSRGRPKRYRELIKKEYAFKQLFRHRTKCADVREADLLTELVFNLIDVPKVSTRRYAQIPIIQRNLPKMIAALRSELQIAGADDNGSSSSTEGGNGSVEGVPDGIADDAVSDIDLLTGGDNSPDDLATLIQAITLPDNREIVGAVVQDVVEEAQDKKKQEDIENACLENVIEAHTCLETALSCLTPDSRLSGVDVQLDNLERKIAELREKITSIC